ncbi:DegT/DnrJ/EryC1/StrS family aminotransferase [Nitrobacter sp.]|uniref:DegT/DnrJ/EryC1/StrS family aminotransferase n=1 Tax=Nitrobacter sp. TaxID=29420 RepID=UPI003F64D3C4
MKTVGLCASVHYAPVCHHSFCRARFGHQPSVCPRAGWSIRKILTLPMFPTLAETDQEDIVRTVAAPKRL